MTGIIISQHCERNSLWSKSCSVHFISGVLLYKFMYLPHTKGKVNEITSFVCHMYHANL